MQIALVVREAMSVMTRLRMQGYVYTLLFDARATSQSGVNSV